jgi:transcriptional regulator of acetoin/glycerol metabolism
MEIKELIGATETARILGIPRQYVWRRTKSGEIVPTLDVGSDVRPQYRYSRAYIEQIAKEQAKGE